MLSTWKEVKAALASDDVEEFSSTEPKVVTNGLEFANGTVFEVFTGNLDSIKADAIVNSTGTGMSMSAGNIAPALLKKAGKALQDECNTLTPIKNGDVVVTKGYGLQCKNVIHVCTPRWTDASTLKNLIVKCFESAEGVNATSIAFSVLGTGVLRYPPEETAKCFLHACIKFANNNTSGSLKKIMVVVFASNQSATIGFEKVLGFGLEDYIDLSVPISASHNKMVEGLPSNWINPVHVYKEFIIKEGTEEWNDCISSFKRTLDSPGSWAVIQVRRIQNPKTYQLYSALRVAAAFELDKSENEVERSLWHGTKEESVRKITKDKFDRVQSRTSCMLGNGTYFSTTAQYSASGYCPPNGSGEKFMIMAKVITGDYTKGESSLKAAPYKDDTTKYYSVVNNVSAPTMFCVFHDDSAYPEYLIKFKKA